MQFDTVFFNEVLENWRKKLNNYFAKTKSVYFKSTIYYYSNGQFCGIKLKVYNT